MITHEQEIEIKNKMIEEKNNQIVKLEMEIERLRSELRLVGEIFESINNDIPATQKEKSKYEPIASLTN